MIGYAYDKNRCIMGKKTCHKEGLHSLSLSIKQKTSHTLALAANCFLLEARKALLSFMLAQDGQPLHDTATLSFCCASEENPSLLHDPCAWLQFFEQDRHQAPKATADLWEPCLSIPSTAKRWGGRGRIETLDFSITAVDASQGPLFTLT